MLNVVEVGRHFCADYERAPIVSHVRDEKAYEGRSPKINVNFLVDRSKKLDRSKMLVSYANENN